MNAKDVAAYPPKLSIGWDQLVLGAAALNVLGLIWYIGFVLPGIVVGATVYLHLTGTLKPLEVSYGAIASLVAIPISFIINFVILFYWGARGLVENKFFRVFVLGIFYLTYSILAYRSQRYDAVAVGIAAFVVGISAVKLYVRRNAVAQTRHD